MPTLVHDRSSGTMAIMDDAGAALPEVARYLRSLELRGLSPRTVRAYAYDLLAIHRWLAAGGRTLRRLHERDLFDFIAAQKSRGARPRSVNRRLTVARLFYRFVTGRELERARAGEGAGRSRRSRGRDWVLGVHKVRTPPRSKLRVRVPRTVVEPLTRKQVLGFLSSLRHYRDIAIVLLMLLAGLRSREVLLLRISDVDCEERRIRVQGKGGKERIVPLAAPVEAAFRDYLRVERPDCETDRLFVVLKGPRRGRPMTAAGLRILFRYRRRTPELASANPHRFRHTFGTDMAREGVRLPILQKMMGHAHAETTSQYIDIAMPDVAAEYERAVRRLERQYRR